MLRPTTSGPLTALAVVMIGLGGCGGDQTPNDTGAATADPAPTAEPVRSAASATATPPAGDSRSLARRLLERSAPQTQYANVPEPVWRARLALNVALSEEPLTALDEALEEARARYSGFGSTVEQARAMGQIAAVAHAVGEDSLAAAALDEIDAAGKAAFDQAEADGVAAVRAVTLARMARQGDGAYAEAFEGILDGMLSGERDQPNTVWQALFEHYLAHPGADELARLITDGRDRLEAAQQPGHPSVVGAVQQLGRWRAWRQIADVMEAHPDSRLLHFDTLAYQAVAAELDGDSAAADRLARISLAAQRAAGRPEVDLAADAEAIAWMRANLDERDPQRARQMFNDNPDITATRKEPGMSNLRGVKREIVAAALIRAGFQDRGYELVGGARGTYALPALIYMAMADAGMWDALVGRNLRAGLPQLLLMEQRVTMSAGAWPDLLAELSRQASLAGETDTAQVVLLSAAEAAPHPRDRAVAREMVRQLGAGDALRTALQTHRNALGGLRGGPSYRLICQLAQEGMAPEHLMAALGTHRLGGGPFDWDNLHGVPEMGTTLAYGALGLDKMW